MALAKSFAHVAKDGQMIVSGKSGQDVLGYYAKALDEISER